MTNEEKQAKQRKITRETAILLVIVITTGLLAIAGLAVSVGLFVTRTNQIQKSRAESAADTCNLITHLIVISAAEAHRVPAGKVFLKRAGLSNCTAYGKKVTALK